MNIDVPSIELIRAELVRLKHSQMQRLASLSEVPFTTLWKIRDGTTKNPGIATVGLFAKHIRVVSQEPVSDFPVVTGAGEGA